MFGVFCRLILPTSFFFYPLGSRETWSIFSFTKPGFFRSPVFGHLSCFGWPKGGDFGERMRCLGCFVG